MLEVEVFFFFFFDDDFFFICGRKKDVVGWTAHWQEMMKKKNKGYTIRNITK